MARGRVSRSGRVCWFRRTRGPRKAVRYTVQGNGQGREAAEMSLDIGAAVQALRSGGRVSRSGWNGKGMWLELQTPDEFSKMTLPYVYMHTAQGGLVPWLCSQTDLLSTDWEVVE